MEKFHVIIAGTRTFDDYSLLESFVDKKLARVSADHDIVVVSGAARGADRLGELYALNRGYEIMRFPADWEQFGKRAGYLRNTQMAEHADALIAFWDGKSRGTQHMIRIATERQLLVSVKLYK